MRLVRFFSLVLRSPRRGRLEGRSIRLRSEISTVLRDAAPSAPLLRTRSWRQRFGCAGVGLTLLVGPALAVQPDEVMKDPALEARARDLSAELRCLVCQNE